VYLQVTLVPINQLKPTFLYVIWLNTWRKSTGSPGVTGITLLGVLYKNMAQLFPGFPYPLTTGAANVDLLPLQHLQCEGVPAAHTHYSTPHNGYKRCSNIKLSISVALKISLIYI